MLRLENRYYKTCSGSVALISGLPLPPIDTGPYEFVNCDFHPCLDKEIEKYKQAGCVFINCEMP